MKLLLEDIKPFVRQGISHANIGAKYNNVFLKTRDSRLFYVISGNGKVEIDGEIYHLSAGSLVLFQSGTEYRWDIGEICIYIVNFDYTFAAEHMTNRSAPVLSADFKSSNFVPHYEFADAPLLNSPIVLNGAFSLGEKIKELVIEAYIKDEYGKELTASLLKSIILNVVRKAGEKAEHSDKSDAALTKRIIDYIQQHFTEDITNEDIAKHLHFNVSYMNRVFKKHTKVTMHRFLLEMRLGLAMEKLKTESLPVNEIALASGFKDIPHFTKIFKKYVGKSPLEYRNSTED